MQEKLLSTVRTQDILDSFDERQPLLSAHTLAKEWYTDPGVFDLEMRHLFLKTWQPLCQRQELPGRGEFKTFTHYGEPLILQRLPDGTLRALCNVCRHNANIIEERVQGRIGNLRCRYHGWTYDQAGRLHGVPEGKSIQNFQKEENGLSSFAVREWGPYIWINADPHAKPMEESVGTMMQEVDAATETDDENERLEHYATVDYDIACNWKVFANNFLDGGYHVNTVHPALAGAVDYRHYVTDLLPDGASVQRTPLKASDDPAVADVRTGTADYYCTKTGFILNRYGNVIDMNIVIPTGPESCCVRFDFFFPKSWSDEKKQESIRISAQIQKEDIEVCENVQKGLKSRRYSSGRFAQRESGAHHFQKAVARDLREGQRQDYLGENPTVLRKVAYLAGSFKRQLFRTLGLQSAV